MNRYYLEITAKTGLSPEAMEAAFDALADALCDLDGVIDPDLGARISTGEFDFTMAVDADDEPTALAKALVAVRCAVHATGGATQGWDEHFKNIQLVPEAPAPA